MKFILPLILALLIATPVHAEKIKSPGWSEGNNKLTGNPRTHGPKRTNGNTVRTVEQEKARKAEMRNRNKSFFSGSTVSKTSKGGTKLTKQIKTTKNKTVGQVWSDMFN